jgi:ribonucleoside-diphosphate reductase alpha chain
MENTVRSAIKGRAVGIGLLGWHTLLQSKNLPFNSIASTTLRTQISKYIYDESIKASTNQAKELGEPEWCKGTGLRHTHHVAIAPTVTNAHISGGVSPSIEPLPANIYNLKTAKGVFIKKNPVLEALLEKKGYNVDSIWNQILKDQGSVLGVPDYVLDKDEKEVFLTFKEINQLGIVQQTAATYKYVDQAISLNLNFDPDDSPKWISQVHKEAWKLGIKTLYYMRTESVLRGDTLSRMDECIACHS